MEALRKAIADAKHARLRVTTEFIPYKYTSLDDGRNIIVYRFLQVVRNDQTHLHE